MPKKNKTVENYQYIETFEAEDAEYQMITACHLETKEYFTLKKVGRKESNAPTYHLLLNQVELLKDIHHISIVKCQRALRTPYYHYFVYNHLEGETLAEYLEKNLENMAFSEKQNIVKQLCLILLQLAKAAVVHLNLSPNCIYISKKGFVRMTGFLWGTFLPQSGQTELRHKVPKSQFVAPEVKKGMAVCNSDVYSLGKIMSLLGLTRTSIKDKRAQELKKLTKEMMAKDPVDRPFPEEVYITITKNKKLKRMHSSTAMGLSNHLSKSSHSMIRNNSVATIPMNPSQLLPKILKKRCVSAYLNEMMKVCLQLKVNDPDLTIMLSTMYLKKSTLNIAKLAKFLNYGTNEPDIELSEKERTKFFKSDQYFKLVTIVGKEMTLQKAELDKVIQVIFRDNVKLLKNQDFNRELKNEDINEQFMKCCVRNWFTLILKDKERLLQLSKAVIIRLFLMVIMLKYSSYQELFRKAFNQDFVTIEDQPYTKRLQNMETADIIAKFKDNVDAR